MAIAPAEKNMIENRKAKPRQHLKVDIEHPLHDHLQ
jgi:hypothetical protein